LIAMPLFEWQVKNKTTTEASQRLDINSKQSTPS